MMNNRLGTLTAVVMTVMLSVAGCGGRQSQPIAPGPAGMALEQTDRSVVFDIQPVSTRGTAPPDSKTWLASYRAGGKVAKFRIEMTLPKLSPKSPVAFGNGVFYRESGSDPSVLLQDLKTALQASQPVPAAKKVAKLTFRTAILGLKLSQDSVKPTIAGAFASNPPGDWIATKLFFNEDDEVFLNLNPATGKGEFSLKDPDYGDAVVRALASVL